MQATVYWKEKLQFEGVSQSGHQVMMDSSNGTAGPSPMELVLLGLGGCTGMDVVSILDKMRLPYEKFELKLESERQTEHPKVFSKVTVIYRIWGQDIPEDKFARAVELTQEKYCSVLHMVNKTAEITYRYEINPAI